MNYFQMAVRAFPHHSGASRMMVHRLRAKYIRALWYLGDRYVLHSSKQVKHKETA